MSEPILVWQSAVCPECQGKVNRTGRGYSVIKGGAYAATPDPRPWKSPIEGLICGCESGPNRRPMNIDWIRNLRDQLPNDVSFYLKQMEIDGRVVIEPFLDGYQHLALPWRSEATR